VGAAVGEVLGAVGVGRVMADGTDEDGAYAARMDEWVAWETVEGTAPRGEDFSCEPPGARVNLFCFFPYVPFSFCHSLVRGARTPKPALPRAEGFLCRSRPATGLFLCIS
jgi:hypothetical protein